MTLLKHILRFFVMYFVGLVFLRIYFKIQDKRDQQKLQDIHKRTDEAINRAFEPIRLVDQKRW